MTYISVDIEADGPTPGDFSMIELGAVVIEPSLNQTFYANFKPISDFWVPEALAITKYSREDTLHFGDPLREMSNFKSWLGALASPVIFVSDNNGFDWQFVNWYFHHFLGSNPFGFSSRNLSDIFKGLTKDMKSGFKHLRKTPHTHHPVDDARGNAEAFLKMQEMGLKVKFD